MVVQVSIGQSRLTCKGRSSSRRPWTRPAGYSSSLDKVLGAAESINQHIVIIITIVIIVILSVINIVIIMIGVHLAALCIMLGKDPTESETWGGIIDHFNVTNILMMMMIIMMTIIINHHRRVKEWLVRKIINLGKFLTEETCDDKMDNSNVINIIATADLEKA